MNIKTGDLVMVVKPTSCCADADGIGTPFIVMNVTHSDCTCTGCHHYSEGMWLVEYEPDNWVGVEQVIKIDPPANKETVGNEELVAA